MNITNYHAIEVKYLGATDTRGSRVRLYSHRFQKSKIIDYDHNFNNTYEIAENWLSNKGFNIVGRAETKDSYLIFTDTFEQFKK